MQTNEHVDLATWLTAVWDEEERRAQIAPMPIYREVHDSCVHPASVLARIAADKEILRLHSGDNDEACQSYAGNWVYEPCETLRLLASPYTDREGFRPEWLVERQGVEHR